MRTSPHKHQVSAVLARRFPLEFCTRGFFYVLRASPRKHRVCWQCSHLGSLWNFARVCLCFACFASQTPGLCSAFPSAPFEFVRLCLSRFASETSDLCSAFLSVPFQNVCTLMFLTFCNAYFPHKHRVCAVPFPRSPVRFVRLSLSCYVMRTSPQEHQFRQEPMTRSLYKYCTLESTLSRFLLFLELRYNRRCDQRRVTSDIASL